MNRRVTIVLAWLSCGCSWVLGAAQLSLGSADANSSGVAIVPLMLQSDAAVAGLQADVVVSPAVAGISISGALGSHAAESAQIGPNSFRIIVYNLFNQPLENGTVLMLQANVSASFTNGTIALQMANVLLASPAADAISGVGVSGGAIRVGGSPAVRLKGALLAQAGALRLEVSGLVGGSFVLEQSADLRSWTEAETIPVQGPNATVLRNIAAGAGAQFYRVRQP